MHIVLGVSGGIAAYKAPDLVRRLRDAGADVRVILTPNAARFVSPLSLAAVSDHGVIIEQWGDSAHGGVDHIELARWADLLLIAPATANIIAKLAVGIADDALTTYAIAHRGDDRRRAGDEHVHARASDRDGEPRHAARARRRRASSPTAVFLPAATKARDGCPMRRCSSIACTQHFATRDLEGKSVLVTAGPTREPIDPVRYISNRSSGKMGYAIAEAARRRGANVTLVSGPTVDSGAGGVARLARHHRGARCTRR